MSLLCDFIVRVAVSVSGVVELLKCHESVHEFVVCVQKAA